MPRCAPLNGLAPPTKPLALPREDILKQTSGTSLPYQPTRGGQWVSRRATPAIDTALRRRPFDYEACIDRTTDFYPRG